MFHWKPLLVVGLAMLLMSPAGFAQGRTGISVKATGSVKLRADVLELEGVVSGNAELAGDAITKYHSNRQRAVESIEALQIPSLVVKSGRIDITSALDQAAQQAMMRGMAAPAAGNRPLNVSEPLSIRIDGIDKLTNEQIMETLVKILDAGKDAGISLGAKDQPGYNPYTGGFNAGGSALARFRLSDVEGARQKAFEDAMANATQQGARLAKLANLKLGQVRSINESVVNTAAKQPQFNPYFGMMAQDSNKEAELFTTSSLQDITVTAALEVEFEVAP